MMPTNLRLKNALGTPIPLQTADSKRLLTKVIGMHELPAQRVVERDKVAQHGSVIEGPTYLEHKLVSLEGELWGTDQDDLTAQETAVLGAFFDATIAPRELLYDLGSLQLKALVRPWGAYIGTPGQVGNQIVYQQQLVVPDIFCLSQAVHSLTTTTDVSGAYHLAPVNAGSAPAQPVITILGPGTEPPQLINATTGQTLACAAIPAAILGDADTMVIDVGARSITLTGAERDDLINFSTSDWWGLVNGTNNLDMPVTGGSSFSVSWRDTYL